MLEAGKRFIGKFFEGIGAAGGFIADFSKKLTNAFIGAINSQVIGPINNGIRRIQDGLNLIPLFGNVKLTTIPNIPKLKDGGLGTKNSLVEISEGNKDEAVIPLENQRVLNKVGTAIAEASPRGRGGEDVTVMVFVGNEPIAAQATKVVRASNKKTARSVKQVPRMV